MKMNWMKKIQLIIEEGWQNGGENGNLKQVPHYAFQTDEDHMKRCFKV